MMVSRTIIHRVLSNKSDTAVSFPFQTSDTSSWKVMRYSYTVRTRWFES